MKCVVIFVFVIFNVFVVMVCGFCGDLECLDLLWGNFVDYEEECLEEEDEGQKFFIF